MALLPRVRALLDFHHADLLESLHLLLEDRLGIECFIPVGREWWDYGYWNFGRSTWSDDRLARQFLERSNVEIEDSHPERRKRCVTYQQAREMRWDFVVASLPDNYPGYHRFAQENDAKLVIQVGNVNQPPGWQYDPYLILNSSSAEVQSRSVTYHQEFLLADFAPTPITNPHTITNLVNCPAQLPCFSYLVTAQVLLDDYEWRIHGIDGPDGNLKPTSKVGEAMQAAGWAWHDKVTGDGFGHVMHGWASVGRPLIGHASHYDGQLAGPFWEDGLTCVDLDRHSLEEAAAIIRDTSPERQQVMGETLAARFAEMVDYDSEAEMVRELLL